MEILKIQNTENGDTIYFKKGDLDTVDSLLQQYNMSFKTLFLILRNKFYISVVFSTGKEKTEIDIILEYIFAYLELKNKKLLLNFRSKLMGKRWKENRKMDGRMNKYPPQHRVHVCGNNGEYKEIGACAEK